MTTYTNETFRMVQDYDLKGALAALQKGGIILYPTDTIWSIGCNASDAEAVNKVYRLKQNATAKSFEILVDSIKMLKEYVVHLHPKIETLLLYHMRPLTVVFDRPRNLPSNVIAQDGTVAVRIVQDEFGKALISEFGKPLLATFASVEDKTFPVNFGAISSEIIEGVDFVVKYRQNEKSFNEPSVVVKLSRRDELIFLRD